MDKYPCYLVCVVCLITRAFAYCPDPDDLPMEMTSTAYLCARVYKNRGCEGGAMNLGNRVVNSPIVDIYGNSWDDVISSVVVRPLCTLHVWEYHLTEDTTSRQYRESKNHLRLRDARKLYGGLHLRITGTELNLANNDRFKVHSAAENGRYSVGLRAWNWNNEISSYYCVCEYSNDPLRCTPTEEYEDIKTCHNPSPGSMKCTQITQRGMTVGESVTKGKSISTSTTLSLGFAKIFSIGLSSSHTTTHDWSRTNSKTYQAFSRDDITCDVPVGHTVTMQQVVGRCGDTVVRTSTYRCQGGTLQ